MEWMPGPVLCLLEIILKDIHNADHKNLLQILLLIANKIHNSEKNKFINYDWVDAEAKTGLSNAVSDCQLANEDGYHCINVDTRTYAAQQSSTPLHNQ